MKTEINVSFNYGGWSLDFRKKIELSFTPFYGLIINDENNYENHIRLDNNEHCTTQIYYDLNKKLFYVDVRNRWKFPIRDEVVDETLEIFAKTNWERVDNTNIDDLKELMNRNAKKQNVQL